MSEQVQFEQLIGLFEQTQQQTLQQAARSIDISLVVRNWLFGWYITEFEICGAEHKELYGKNLIQKLSDTLTKQLGKGFSRRYLETYKNFYSSHEKIRQTVFAISFEQENTLLEIQQTPSVTSSDIVQTVSAPSIKADNSEIRQTASAKSFEDSTKTENHETASRKSTEGKIAKTVFSQFSEISPTVSDQSLDTFFAMLIENSNVLREITTQLSQRFILGWSHYVTLLTVDDEQERRFYELEAAENSWSVRELKRQIASSLYERLALSRNKNEIRQLAEEGLIVEKAADIIKNPLVLEFLDLPEHNAYSEHELESAIITKIEQFLLELGKGFLFEARQKRFTFDDDHFYVDLVFYNRLLRSYVLIDLKRDKLSHQDLGQMQMYVNYFDRHVKTDDEAPTIGIVLCHRKNDALVELTLPDDSNIYASKYQLYLPSKEELRDKLLEIEAELSIYSKPER